MEKRQSRLLLLSSLCEFALGRRFSDGTPWPPSSDWAFQPIEPGEVRVGDLVALQSAVNRGGHPWYLSWVLACDFDRDHRWLLEAVDDGSQAWWGNVGFLRFTGPIRPEWRWTDRQHAFAKRWGRVCAKSDDGYIHRSAGVVFGDGWHATVGTRIAFGLSEERPVREVSDWRRVTVSTLKSLYAECVAEANASKRKD